MSILYKSSSLETSSYYIIFPLLIGISAFFIVGILSYGSFSLFTILFLLIFIYVFIMSVDSFYRLRYVEVTEDSIIIKTIRCNKIIKFKDVEYVYNLININGNSLVLWYNDIEKNKSRVILVRPEEKNSPAKVGFPLYFYGSYELEITKFIKEKAIKENPNYLYNNKPRWFLYGLN